MEVLGNSSQLKESEVRTPEINYNCRLPRDVNVGVNPGAKGKGETDINLLVACKVQLSSEVIRWKTETLRLQKERDSAQLQTKELDQMLAKLRERYRELEDRLMQAEDENRHMKSTSFSADKERACLVQRLNHSINKCSSLESPVKPEVSRFQALESRKFVLSPQEDWREVSQKMLQQMKNEMKELQEMSVHYQSSEKENVQDTSSEVDADYKEEVKVELSNLLCEAQSMKQQFLQQRQKLESILQNVISGGFSKQDQLILNKSRDTDSLYADVQNLASSNPRRMSAEDYRLHFSKQLENTSDPKKVARKVQHFLKNPDLCVLQKDSTVASEELKSPDLLQCPPDEAEEASEVKTEDSEKVCPICQITFRASVSQSDFEEHVLNHLERESASLLDQYVIV
ncbi:hypothetical protein AVEN_100064-1 [Araneus ventricosus]|uniref:UBZ1-type domain-containing protein n=1 Tax=Araneus ventricosus TaxID=182803 RepID=A0A4Y2MT91_ARAVE|nr:hypothetical protein AVEN_100064-1 [Araneus ventricosus]